jgi:hypothetical protein
MNKSKKPITYVALVVLLFLFRALLFIPLSDRCQSAFMQNVDDLSVGLNSASVTATFPHPNIKLNFICYLVGRVSQSEWTDELAPGDISIVFAKDLFSTYKTGDVVFFIDNVEYPQPKVLNRGGGSASASQNVILWPGKHHVKVIIDNYGVYEWDFEITW